MLELFVLDSLLAQSAGWICKFLRVSDVRDVDNVARVDAPRGRSGCYEAGRGRCLGSFRRERGVGRTHQLYQKQIANIFFEECSRGGLTGLLGRHLPTCNYFPIKMHVFPFTFGNQSIPAYLSSSCSTTLGAAFLQPFSRKGPRKRGFGSGGQSTWNSSCVGGSMSSVQACDPTFWSSTCLVWHNGLPTIWNSLHRGKCLVEHLAPREVSFTWCTWTQVDLSLPK